MIKARFKLTNPNDAEATLTMTMTVGEWHDLGVQLSGKYPSWPLSVEISKLIVHAQQAFEAEFGSRSDG